MYNEQYQDALDKIEVGLEGFEILLALSRGMTKVMSDYDVFQEVEETYDREDHQIWKDFIKVGMEFIRGRSDIGQLEINVTKVDVDHDTVELSQFDSGSVQTEQATTNDEVHEMIGDVDEVHLSQDDNSPKDHFTTPVIKEKAVEDATKKKRKKKRKKEKEKGHERLLNYHRKLVKTCGMPPSRLMEDHKPQGWPDVRKSLVSDFEQIGGEVGSVVSSPAEMLPPPAPAVPEPQGYYQQPSAIVCGDGTTSNTYSLPMLCSIPQPPVGGYQGLSQSPGCVVGGVSTGWQNAHPILGSLSDSPGLNIGSSSGLSQHQSLSPMYQPSVGLYQPTSPVGRPPAFCFHCLQYGSVYTISPV